jgi:hypothetical protein
VNCRGFFLGFSWEESVNLHPIHFVGGGEEAVPTK